MGAVREHTTPQGIAAGDELLRVEAVTQSYGMGERSFVALQDIRLDLRGGEFVALLGPSGCGKSTLLRIITGLQRPTTGQVLYRGRPLEGINTNAAIVFQTFALFPWLTVQENVEVALKARGVPPKLRTGRALDLIDQVGLDGFETAYPRELSGGMRQKVGFARAMAVEPELLCLDEPFSALDVLSAETLRGDLLELWTTGVIPTRAILMVTHSIEEAVQLTDRVIVMDKGPGRVVAEMKVDLPHPRRRKDPAFLALVDRVYALLAGQTLPERAELGSAPGEPGLTRALPDVDIENLIGLIEHLAQQPGNRADLYRLTEELHANSQGLLALVEATELLGMATVAQGDIVLTPLAETFAEASIVARKEIYASRLRRIPLLRWLMNLLRSSERGVLERGVVRAALGFEFSPEDADHQIDVAIEWGRYAELIAYDDDTEQIYLASAPPS